MEKNEYTPDELFRRDVDDEGATSGYGVETYLCRIETVHQREGEDFVRVALDSGGGYNCEVRIPVQKWREIASKLTD